MGHSGRPSLLLFKQDPLAKGGLYGLCETTRPPVIVMKIEVPAWVQSRYLSPFAKGEIERGLRVQSLPNPRLRTRLSFGKGDGLLLVVAIFMALRGFGKAARHSGFRPNDGRQWGWRRSGVPGGTVVQIVAAGADVELARRNVPVLVAATELGGAAVLGVLVRTSPGRNLGDGL